MSAKYPAILHFPNRRHPDAFEFNTLPPSVGGNAAIRLGEPETAIDILLMDTPANRYLLNGHNYQNAALPCYLPGNGGLLTATAMLALRPAPQGWRFRRERLSGLL